ncbi:60s acidic ribosomal protein [Salix suchowensis]|nr:60s acidic ribosomal protein [Salix suchowensis]
MKLNSSQGTQGQDLDTVVPPVPSIPIIPNTPQTPHTRATHAPTKSGGDSARERGRREEEGGRSSSPEIGEILASTPRPARSKSRPRVGQSGGSKSAPGSRRGSAANSASISRSTSVASAASMPKSLSRSASRSTTSTASVLSASTSRTSRSTGGGVLDFEADEFGFIGGVGAYMSDGEDEDGAGSDSSLDLHTPLPHLMVKHGMLSPNSKLLPAGMSTFVTSFGDAGGSTTHLSTTNSPANASTSKGKGGKGAGNGLLKDERDTVKRRTRHRDGSLLRGGIGLTTGLGWSDRRGCPVAAYTSALDVKYVEESLCRVYEIHGSMGSMRSVGSIGMGRVHSMGSMGSIGKGGKRHPLSRSYSSPNDGILLERDEHEHGGGNAGYDEFGYPTEGKSYNEYGNEGEYGQDWDDGDLNGDTEVFRASIIRAGATRTGSGSGTVNGSKVGAMRMSSSLSGKGKGGLGFVNRDKGLPPLPPLSRQASSASIKSTTTPVPTNHTHATASVGGNRIPRPLQLPRHSSMRSGNGNGGVGGGDRSPVPVPSVPSSSPAVLASYSRSFGSGVSVASGHNGTSTGNVGLSASMSMSSVTLSTPASGESAIGKPKPRTGTGMVYRSSVTSRMRVPSAPMLGRAVGIGGAGQKTAVL